MPWPSRWWPPRRPWRGEAAQEDPAPPRQEIGPIISNDRDITREYVQEGWVRETDALTVSVFHDGGAVTEIRPLWTPWTVPIDAGGAAFAECLADAVFPLAAEQLGQYADWFNQLENNGLLRFACSEAAGVGDYTPSTPASSIPSAARWRSATPPGASGGGTRQGSTCCWTMCP